MSGQLGVSLLGKVPSAGHAALLWTLPSRVSAVAREGRQESATSHRSGASATEEVGAWRFPRWHGL